MKRVEDRDRWRGKMKMSSFNKTQPNVLSLFRQAGGCKQTTWNFQNWPNSKGFNFRAVQTPAEFHSCLFSPATSMETSPSSKALPNVHSPGETPTPKGLLGMALPAKKMLMECMPSSFGVYSTYHTSSVRLTTVGLMVSFWPLGSRMPTSTCPRPAPAMAPTGSVNFSTVSCSIWTFNATTTQAFHGLNTTVPLVKTSKKVGLPTMLPVFSRPMPLAVTLDASPAAPSTFTVNGDLGISRAANLMMTCRGGKRLGQSTITTASCASPVWKWWLWKWHLPKKKRKKKKTCDSNHWWQAGRVWTLLYRMR